MEKRMEWEQGKYWMANGHGKWTLQSMKRKTKLHEKLLEEFIEISEM
jgi:hypothetical protein